MFGAGWQEILVVGIVFLVLFGGARKLPELGRSIGKMFVSFKQGLKEGEAEFKKASKEEEEDK